jgi:hypothetical protein
MRRKPRVVSQQAVELGEMIDKAVEARVGPNATFEERQDAAAAVAGEVLAEFRKLGVSGPKAGS